MTLEDILNQLEVSELSQLAMVERENGYLTETAKKGLVTHVNMGLTAIHKRFVLNHKEATIRLDPERLSYMLDKKFAMSNDKSQEPVKYIDDMESPFENDVMQILAITDDMGNEIPLDDGGRKDSARKVNFKTVVLPNKQEGTPHLFDTTETMTAIYRAKPRQLTHMDMVLPAEMVEVDLPDVYLEAIVYFIASRVMNPIGMNETFHEGNNYASKYERACQEARDGGYELSSPGQGSNFHNSGWV